jgi:glucose-6-phosphate 1-dehydrogenase
MVIFGATGDLANNKLIPALFSLYKKNHLPKDFYIFGFARRPFSDEEFREMFSYVEKNNEWEEFAKHLFYQQGTFQDPTGYEELIKKLEDLDKQMGACITRLFYLATPPSNYETILDHLSSTKLAEGCGQGSNKWTKLIIEKPFGKDLETAKKLDEKLASIFEEKQIFRVDHYLGKDTVQNIIAFRFANSIFEPVWSNEYIDHVQVTLSEKNDVSNRGKFYDGVGNLRDVGQNHLMQLVAAVAMEQPISFTKEAVRDVRAHAIQAIRCIEPEKVHESVVRGQYEGYRNERDVDPASMTETYVAAKFFIDTPRFRDVPFYVRAGKKMKKDEVTISLVFKQTCHILFKEYGCPEEGNILTFRIQPNEGISLRVIAKRPGAKVALGTVNMKFNYEDEYGEKGIDAYQKLLLDVFCGDQTLFNRSDELESSWTFITDILKGWEMGKSELPTYAADSMGPKEADDLIQKDNRKWI